MEFVCKCLSMLLCATENLYYVLSSSLERKGEMCGKVSRAEENDRSPPYPPEWGIFYMVFIVCVELIIIHCHGFSEK